MGSSKLLFFLAVFYAFLKTMGFSPGLSVCSSCVSFDMLVEFLQVVCQLFILGLEKYFLLILVY